MPRYFRGNQPIFFGFIRLYFSFKTALGWKRFFIYFGISPPFSSAQCYVDLGHLRIGQFFGTDFEKSESPVEH